MSPGKINSGAAAAALKVRLVQLHTPLSYAHIDMYVRMYVPTFVRGTSSPKPKTGSERQMKDAVPRFPVIAGTLNYNQDVRGRRRILF